MSARARATTAPQPASAVNGPVFVQRKCACGGSGPGLTGECEECRRNKLIIQPKLRVNEPADAYEREADRIAEDVSVRDASPGVRRPITRLPSLSSDVTGDARLATADVNRVLASGGRPLPIPLRQDMEGRFGHDFSRVRVHTDAVATDSARRLNANAYTVGHDIVFGEGRFLPSFHSGRALLAHELTHVVQQTGAGAHAIQRQTRTPNSPHEGLSIVTIVAFPGSKTGVAYLSDRKTTEPVELKENSLPAGEYTFQIDGPPVDSHERQNYRSSDQQHLGFRWIKKHEYEWAPEVKVLIQQDPKQRIEALPPHIRNFLTTSEGTVASEAEILKVAIAGRILASEGVTEDELLLLRGRVADLEGIGGPVQEAEDPESWALDFVAQRKARQSEQQANEVSLLGLASRLGEAPTSLYEMQPLLEIIEMPSKLSAYDVGMAIERRTIATPFRDLSDLRQTLQAFETSLVTDLRDLATAALDDTESRLLRMDRQFVGLWQKKQWAPGYLGEEIHRINADPDVAKEKEGHRERVARLDEEQKKNEPSFVVAPSFLPSTNSFDRLVRLAEIDDQRDEEDERYKEALRTTVAAKSNVKLSPGLNVEELLGARSAEEAQQRLVDFLVDGRTKVARTRSRIGDPKVLYAADRLLAIEKENITTAIGNGRGRVAGYLIDHLASERRSETTIWQDLWKVFEFVSMFIPGPIGWGLRFAEAAVDFNSKMEDIGVRADLYSTGLSSTAPKSSEVAWAGAEFLMSALPEPGSFPGGRSTKPFSLGLGRTGVETTSVAERKLLGVGEQSIAREAPLTGAVVDTERAAEDAVAYVEQHPNITGQPGARHAPVGEGHEIREVIDETVEGGIACEYHSPPPAVRVPCPRGLGNKRETVEEFEKRGGVVKRDIPSQPTPEKLESEVLAAPEETLPEGYEDLPYAEARTRKQASISLEEDHHIASRYVKQNKAAFDKLGISIDDDLNLVKDFGEHGQLRGWYKSTERGFEFQMKGHHKEYNQWVTDLLTRATHPSVAPDEAVSRVATVLQELQVVVRENPDVLAYGPVIFKNRPDILKRLNF
jgi:hypothetical protein